MFGTGSISICVIVRIQKSYSIPVGSNRCYGLPRYRFARFFTLIFIIIKKESAFYFGIFTDCQFDWKERMGGWHQNIGFVADELEEIDPNLALGGGYDENGEMDIKQINSPYLLNYAIKAIQELSAKVDEQEKRIKELERRLQ